MSGFSHQCLNWFPPCLNFVKRISQGGGGNQFLPVRQPSQAFWTFLALLPTALHLVYESLVIRPIGHLRHTHHILSSVFIPLSSINSNVTFPVKPFLVVLSKMSLSFRIYDFVLLFNYCFETWLYDVAWAGDKPSVLQLQPSKCWDYSHHDWLSRSFSFYSFKGLLIFKGAYKFKGLSWHFYMYISLRFACIFLPISILYTPLGGLLFLNAYLCLLHFLFYIMCSWIWNHTESR